MNKIYSLLSILALLSLTSCSGSSTGAVQVSVTSTVLLTIPAAGTSCYASKSAIAAGTTPTPDIAAAYFRIPKVTFQISDKTRDTYVSLINVTFTPPGGSETTCAFGGDQLAALYSTWWSNTNKEAVIKAGATSASTDCAMYCGGLNINSSNFTASGTVKVYGYTQDPNNDNDQQGFSSTTYFNYGTQY